MRALLQRVSQAQVDVLDDRGNTDSANGVDDVGNTDPPTHTTTTTGRIGLGLLILLGIGPNDTPAISEALATKVTKLRIFPDDHGKMNRSVLDVGGGCLVVSQFTLYANAKKGNRPSYTQAAPPALAQDLYQHFCQALRARGIAIVETGQFAAHMHVHLINDGPVTLWLDTDELF